MKNISLVDVDLKRDIQEISAYIQNYVDTTYLSQIRKQVKTHKRQCDQTPFAEVQLLEAMVPFVEDKTKDKLLSMIKMITYSKMIQNMLPDYTSADFLSRVENGKAEQKDYVHQAIVAFVLYNVIVWAEEYEDD